MNNPDLDEVPVAGAQKTFDDLLEEKLREEGQNFVIKREIPKKEFLRKKSNSSFEPKDYKPIEKEFNPNEKEYKPIEKEYKNIEKYLKPIEKDLKPIEKEYKQSVKSKPIEDNFGRTNKKPKTFINEGSTEKNVITKATSEPNIKKQFLKRGEGKLCLNNKNPDKKPSKNDETPLIPKKNPEKDSFKPNFDHKPEEKTWERPKKLQNEDTIEYDPSALNCQKGEIFTKTKEDPIKTPEDNLCNEKLLQLNSEIEKIKSICAVNKKINKELKSKIKELDKELEFFIEHKIEKISELQSFKESEVKRIKRERHLLEKNSKVTQQSKTDEIEEIKLSIFKVQEELNNKEMSEKEAQENISKELQSLNNEINALEAQVRIREQLLIKENFKKPKKQASEVVLDNGIRIKNYPDGKNIIYFPNGDVKEVHPDGKVIYHYDKDGTIQTNFADGVVVYEFNSGQIEKLFPNGRKEITFPDGSTQSIYPEQINKKSGV